LLGLSEVAVALRLGVVDDTLLAPSLVLQVQDLLLSQRLLRPVDLVTVGLHRSLGILMNHLKSSGRLTCLSLS
jgi:hypothetical protein